MKNLKTVLESRIDESKVSIDCLEDPKKNVEYDLTPDWYEGGFLGILIGKLFKYGDSNGDTAALKLVKKFWLDLGNDYDTIVKDMENEYGRFINSVWFTYLLNNKNYEVDCYVFGDGGICALM